MQASQAGHWRKWLPCWSSHSRYSEASMVRWQEGQRTVGMAPIVLLFFYTVNVKSTFIADDPPSKHLVPNGDN